MNSTISISRLCFALTIAIGLAVTQSSHAELVGYWPLDGDLNDFSGQGNHGEPIGDPEFSDEVNPHFAGGQSLFFDGDDAVLLGNPGILNFGTSDFSISAWVKKSADPDARGNIYSNGGDNGGGIRSVLAIGETGGADAVVLTLDVDQGDGAKRQAVSTDEADGFPALTAPDDEWNHVLGMRVGNEARVYVNGELADIISLREDPPYDLSGMSQLPSYLGVGASAASDPIGAFEKFYTGLIDDVSLWNEALDDDFISFLSIGGGILEAPENPGDFNMDGSLDVADFAIMAENFNQSFPIKDSFAKGDNSRDGKVDLVDFAQVRLLFNAAGGGTAAASVPEPAGVGMSLLALLAFAVARRRR